MSSDLDEISKSLFNGTLPFVWQRLAPATLKSLGNWMNHFIGRHKQYKTWVSLYVTVWESSSIIILLCTLIC